VPLLPRGGADNLWCKRTLQITIDMRLVLAVVMEFGVLGPVVVWVGGRAVDVGHARQRAVLAVLLLDAGRAVPLDVLIDRVWGEDPPRSVRNVVYGYVGRLKALIASGQDPDVTLSRRAGGYLLQAGPDQVDVGRFRRLVADAAAAGDDEGAGVLLGEAVALWRGSALSGLDSPWLNGQRARLELERAAAMLDLGEIRLRRGEHAALAGELVGRAAGSPADERLVGQLMLALYRCGRQEEALRWFEQTRRYLADEVGTDPGSKLRALHERILRADRYLTLAPETVARPAVPVPRELPADVPAFTGRAAELAELDRLLAASDLGADTRATAAASGNRSVTAAVISAVSGTAGVGKTALAVHWAHRTVERFPDGQLYVNLRGYDPDQPMTAADALAGFLRALGVPGQDIPPGEDERAARYRSLVAGKQILVVLDNASGAEQVRPLLPGSPACAGIVTSRDSLAGLVARDGVARLDLDLLTLDEAVALLQELIGERAVADPEAAAALAAHCCRLPLALRVAAELAASRPDVSLADLVADLATQQRPLDLFDAAGDPRTAVRAVFSWSYGSLDPSAARAFRFAGLHPGPDFDAYAIAALTAATLGQAREALDTLARAHLIHPTGPGRFAMHDLLRAYARELAAADRGNEQHQALTRLFDYYLHAAASAMDALYPAERQRRPTVDPPGTPTPRFTESALARAWLDEQRAVLAAVAAHCAEKAWPGHAARLDATVARYLEAGGYLPEAITMHDHARRAARRTGDHTVEAAALIELGIIALKQGRYERAALLFRQSLSVSRETGDRTSQARALGNLGIIDRRQGRYDQAAVHYRQALALLREVGDRVGQVRSIANLGMIDWRQGRYDQAASHCQQALTISREIGDQIGQANTLSNLATIHRLQGRYEEAAAHNQQALTLSHDISSPDIEAHTLAEAGAIEAAQAHWQPAAAYHRQALVLCREIGDRTVEAVALNGLGEVLLATGQPRDAHIQLGTALTVAAQAGDKYEEARAHTGLGHAHRAMGDTEKARRHWRQALSLFTDLGVPETNEVRAHLASHDHAVSGDGVGDGVADRGAEDDPCQGQ
jgi:tetratricopeptide (TPR) repeat protein